MLTVLSSFMRKRSLDFRRFPGILTVNSGLLLLLDLPEIDDSTRDEVVKVILLSSFRESIFGRQSTVDDFIGVLFSFNYGLGFDSILNFIL